MVTFALAKGRLAEEGLLLLKKVGIECETLEKSSRKLILYSESKEFRFLFVKPSDVPIYVDHGIADVGIVGKDTLLEEGRKLYELLDLGYAKCKIVVAGFPDKNNLLITRSHTRVATKYPNIARGYFSRLGEMVDIIKLNGSVELGPLTDLSDVIVDIMESGRTLIDNGLVVLEEICDVSARLVVNRVSLKTKSDIIKKIIKDLETVLEAPKDDENY